LTKGNAVPFGIPYRQPRSKLTGNSFRKLKSSKEGGINGSHVYDFFLEGRHEEIADYCMRDVELVRDVYYRMNFLD
jgi:predicted PolB exonuclease-like 3'-5' exonuclease